jgi:hypothetical protein
MSRTPAILLLTMVLALAAIFSGCGKKSTVGATADATAQAFAAALEAGQYDAAASAFDYIAEARKQNENWDDIPSGERSQIIKKVAKMKAEELPALKQRLGSGIKAGAAQSGTVSVGGANGSVTLQMMERDGKWYIAELW